MSDLYKLLELDKHATPADIKRAYKLMAKKHHPDKGGSNEKFSEIKKAYDILSDPESRKDYDLNGTTEIRDPKRTAVAAVIQKIAATIDKQGAFDTQNLFRLTERELQGELQNINTNLKGAEKHLKKLNRLSKRIIRKHKGENLFTDMVAEKILQMEVNIRNIEFQRDLNAAMMELLEDYDYESLMELEGASEFSTILESTPWTTF